MRRLFSLLAVALIVAGCSASGPSSNGSVPSSPIVISPYIQGFSLPELNAYLDWWRTANMTEPSDGWQGPVINAGVGGDATLPITSVRVPLDPTCPLRYDYDQMKAVTFENGDGLQLTEVSDINSVQSGFYNTERSEALMILRGTAFGANCDGAEGYLVVRVSLEQGSERWIIDGLASPAATLTVAVDPGNKAIKVADNKVELAGVDSSYYSPFRLRRFAITDTNRERVFSFAQMSSSYGQIGRRLLWFRASDLAGAYAQSGCAPLAAFWGREGSGGDCKTAPNLKTNTEGGLTSTTWLDEMARQGDVINNNEDDNNCGSQGDSCYAYTNELWGRVSKVTKEIAKLAGLPRSPEQTAGPASDLQMTYFAQLLAGSGGGAADICDEGRDLKIPKLKTSPITPNDDCSYKIDQTLPSTRIPDELIAETREGVVYPYADVFAVLVSGGTQAAEDTRDRMKESVALQSVIGYFADGDRVTGDTVTISPSYRYVGGETSDWYERFSYLFGSATSQGPASMTFSTASGSERSLRYDPSPASQIRITVTDTLNPNVKVNYASEWIPTQAIGQFDDPTSSLGECDTFAFDCHITRAITGFTTSIYQATFGAMLEGLSKGSVGNMLGVPILQQYELDAVRDVVGGQQSIYKLNEERLKSEPCKGYAASARLNRFTSPTSSIRDEPSGGEECYQQSGTWGLFNAARGLMIVLLVVFIARYVLQLMVGRARQMTIAAFVARCFISLFLILYIGDVLRFLGTIVAEVIVITNTIGSQVSGKPYSHLWMFSAYLSSPPAGANPFALLLMAPFTILGLLVMAIVGWVRLVLAALIVAASPIWIINLLSEREPRFFYQSLMFLLRLYVIPVIALVLMLAVFLLLGSNDSFFGGSNDGIVSIPRAIVGMGILIVVAVVPVFAAKSLINKVGKPIQSAIQGALAAADDDRAENFLNNTGAAKDKNTGELISNFGAPPGRTSATLADASSGYTSGNLPAGGESPALGSPGASDAALTAGTPASDPMASLTAPSSAELGRLPAGDPAAQGIEAGAAAYEAAAIEARAADYASRGYDDEAALLQADKDVRGEAVEGGWARQAFSLGGEKRALGGHAKKLAFSTLGAMTGGLGVTDAARASLPGWAQKAVTVGERAATLGVQRATGVAGDLADRAGGALKSHQHSVEKAEEARRDWAGAEGASAIAAQRLAEATASGDPARLATATAEYKRANAKAQAAYRRVDEAQRTFAGRMSKIGVPVVGAGLRLRDGLTTDARAAKKHLEKIDREIDRHRAARMVSESGQRQNPSAIAKIDAKLVDLERRRSEQASRVATYDARGEVAGRRRQSAEARDLNRARLVSARTRSIEAVRRGASGSPVGIREALDRRQAEARRAAAIAAARAGLHKQATGERIVGLAGDAGSRVVTGVERLDQRTGGKLSGTARRLFKGNDKPTGY